MPAANTTRQPQPTRNALDELERVAELPEPHAGLGRAVLVLAFIVLVLTGLLVLLLIGLLVLAGTAARWGRLLGSEEAGGVAEDKLGLR